MKKSLRSLVCLLLAVITLISVTAPVYAADWKDKYKVQALAAGKTAKGKQRVTDYDALTRKHTIYKITVKADGYLTLVNKADEIRWIRLYASVKDAKAQTNSLKWVEGQKQRSYPVTKGTYYIYPEGDYNFKYTFKKAPITADNYCKARAAALKAKKKATICVPKGYAFTRWYKIKLTKKKDLTITFKDLTILPENATAYPNFSLYNSAGERINVTQKEGFNYVAKKAAKGTYYIKVTTTDESTPYLYVLSWK